MKILAPALALLISLSTAAQEQLPGVQHGEVQFEVGRFGGWPANGGIWNWGNEILTVFSLGYFDPEKKDGHPIDGDRPSGKMQARSLDGGVTWTLERPSFLGEGTGDKPATELTAPMDFSAPDFSLMFLSTRFVYSNDRGKTWHGPHTLPTFGRPGLLARTDYIINGPQDLMAFMATEKDDGEEGWPAAIRTRDGGLTWTLEGMIGAQPGDGEYSIMPSTLRLKDGALYSWIRHRRVEDGRKIWFIDAYRSADDGKTWEHRPETFTNNAGNPPHMLRLADGRLAVTYGHRTAPYGIRARISADEGETWGGEFIIRGDGGGWDIGYPRTVQRPDGKCVTVYYFHDGTRPERHIAYSIWTPPRD